MDYQFIMFIIGFSCFLGLLTYTEAVYKRNKQKKRNKIAVERMENFIKQAKTQKEMKRKLAEKDSMIDYYMRFRLEYDPDTHTYAKIEKVPDKETDLYKVK